MPLPHHIEDCLHVLKEYLKGIVMLILVHRCSLLSFLSVLATMQCLCSCFIFLCYVRFVVQWCTRKGIQTESVRQEVDFMSKFTVALSITRSGKILELEILISSSVFLFTSSLLMTVMNTFPNTFSVYNMQKQTALWFHSFIKVKT